MPSCNCHPIHTEWIYPFSDPEIFYRSLMLTKRSHKPHDILHEVKGLTRQPDYRQQQAREEFVELYQNWIGMRTPNDVQQLKNFKRDLTNAMQALDVFFFSGCLTRPFPYGESGEPIAELKVQDNIFGMALLPGHQAFLNTGLPLPLGTASWTGESTTISIDTLKNGSPATVESIFETLVHEMAHAIFLSFACGGTNCQRAATHPSILGQIGHGDKWVEMAEHMRDTIQTWHHDLAHFYNTNDIRRHNRDLN